MRAETDRVFAGLQYVYDIVGASTETIESIPAAIALVARGAGDPVRTALLCANLGGDTETIGAIAVGALSGYASIPADYIDTLNEVNELSLQPLAAQLLSFRQLRTERSRR